MRNRYYAGTETSGFSPCHETNLHGYMVTLGASVTELTEDPLRLQRCTEGSRGTLRRGLARGNLLGGRLGQGLLLGGGLLADVLGQGLHVHEVLQRHLPQHEEEVRECPRIKTIASLIACME